MQFRPPVPRRMKTWGWPWHGLIIEPTTGPAYIELPNGAIHQPPVLPGRTMQGGHWTYLWDIGLPDLVQTPEEIEAGQAWWGKAILRSRGAGVGQAYGAVNMSTGDGSGASSWPVLLDDGAAWVRMNPSTAGDGTGLILRFDFRRTIVGADPVDPVEVTLPANDYGQGAGQPKVYTTRVESLSAHEAVVSFAGAWDFTPNGRSALAAFVAVYLSPFANDGGHNIAGLIRIDISGTLAAPSVSVTVLHDRQSALGELVHEYSGGMQLKTYGFAQREQVSLVQPPPACGVTEYVAPGAIVEASPGLFQAYVGTDTSTYGQRGALAAAWFDGDAVREVRFDSLATLTATSSTSDASSGEWRERSTYTYSEATGQCERTEYLNEDTRLFDFHAHRAEEATYTLRLYGSGIAEQTTTLRRVSTLDGRYFPSDMAQTIDTQASTVFQGAEEFETTESSSPGILGSSLPWGYQLADLVPVYSLVNGYWQMSVLDHAVLFCSNKLVTLGQLERKDRVLMRGPYDVKYGPLISPSGLITPGVSLTVPDAPVGAGTDLAWNSVTVQQATKAAWNPVTHEVCRHRIDIQNFGWV